MMNSSRSAARHITWEKFSELISTGNPFIQEIQGVPIITIFYDPTSGSLGLRVKGATLPNEMPLQNISVNLVDLSGIEWVELKTTDPQLHREFFFTAIAISDRIQIEEQSLDDACRAAGDAWRTLLARITGLGHESEVGLIGELMALEIFASRIGWKRAVRSWKGPESGEHDFVLPNADVEVKTTTMERREHFISGTRQLVPRPHRPLYLFSFQITSATRDAHGLNLAQRVAAARKSVRSAAPGAADQFDELLRTTGWQDEHGGLYSDSYSLRSEPALMIVGDNFPVLTPGCISTINARSKGKIVDASYRIDVEGVGLAMDQDEFGSLLKVICGN